MTFALADLHAHVVPGVDDGPVTPAEALRLLEKMRGTMPAGSLVAVTPHYSTSMGSFALASRMKKACDFAAKASNGQLTLICAGELRLGMRKSTAHALVCYPGTRWTLVEFSPGLPWFWVVRRSMRLLGKGYRPLIAHAERYGWATPRKLRWMTSLGVGISMSLRSFSMPRYGERAARLLEGGSFHVLTSDCHRERDLTLGEEARSLVEKICPGGWRTLTAENPGRILRDALLPALKDMCHG